MLPVQAITECFLLIVLFGVIFVYVFGDFHISLKSFGTIFLTGLLLVYLIVTVIPSIADIANSWLVMGLFFIVLALSWQKRLSLKVIANQIIKKPLRSSIRVGALSCLVAILLISYFLGNPLIAHDARSIWFFHGKIAFLSDAMLSKVWLDPALHFSHVDYPKLNAALVALLASKVGYWNEYFPRFSEILFIGPPILLLCSYSKSISINFGLILAAVCFPAQLNGYMDGYLATYSAVAILFGTRYLYFSNDILDLWIAIFCLGICTGLKNEGSVLTAIIVFAYGPSIFKKHRFLNQDISINFKQILPPLLLAFSPILIWRVWCIENGIGNDLVAGGLLDRLVTRISSKEALKLILNSVFGSFLFRQTLYFVGAWLLLSGRRKQVLSNWRILIEPTTVLGIYVATILYVYLTTYWELQEHLNSSASRVILPLTSIILCLPLILLEFEYHRNVCTSKNLPITNKNSFS